jgi:hypothetical protein
LSALSRRWPGGYVIQLAEDHHKRADHAYRRWRSRSRRPISTFPSARMSSGTAIAVFVTLRSYVPHRLMTLLDLSEEVHE